jgi:hypothetical protein
MSKGYAIVIGKMNSTNGALRWAEGFGKTNERVSKIIPVKPNKFVVTGFILDSTLTLGMNTIIPTGNYSSVLIAQGSYSLITGGVENKSEDRWIAYPNPCAGILKIRTSASEIKSILVSDIQGKEILKCFDENEIRLQQPGVYFITIEGRDGSMKTMKVINIE